MAIYIINIKSASVYWFYFIRSISRNRIDRTASAGNPGGSSGSVQAQLRYSLDVRVPARSWPGVPMHRECAAAVEAVRFSKYRSRYTTTPIVLSRFPVLPIYDLASVARSMSRWTRRRHGDAHKPLLRCCLCATSMVCAGKILRANRKRTITSAATGKKVLFFCGTGGSRRVGLPSSLSSREASAASCVAI